MPGISPWRGGGILIRTSAWSFQCTGGCATQRSFHMSELLIPSLRVSPATLRKKQNDSTRRSSGHKLVYLTSLYPSPQISPWVYQSLRNPAELYWTNICLNRCWNMLNSWVADLSLDLPPSLWSGSLRPSQFSLWIYTWCAVHVPIREFNSFFQFSCFLSSLLFL